MGISAVGCSWARARKQKGNRQWSHWSQQRHSSATPGGSENHGDSLCPKLLQRGTAQRRCLHRYSHAARHSLCPVLPAGRVHPITILGGRPGSGIHACYPHAGRACLASSAFSQHSADSRHIFDRPSSRESRCRSVRTPFGCNRRAQRDRRKRLVSRALIWEPFDTTSISVQLTKIDRNGARRQLALLEQFRLVFANLLRAQTLWRTLEAS